MRNVAGLSWIIGGVSAVILGLSAGRADAQEVPMPATPTPPPDVQERERVPDPPAPPGRPPEVDELLRQLGVTRADIERRKAAPGARALAATPQEPPDVQERKGIAEPPAPPARSPSVEELLEAVRRQPGGPELLERARRGGARIPPGRPGGSSGSTLNGGRGPWAEDASPAFLSVAGEMQTVLRVTRTAAYTNVSGLGTLSAGDQFPYFSNAYTLWGPLQRYAYSSHPIVGPVDVRPFMWANVSVASEGWYLVNFVATRGRASLRKYGPSSGSPPMFPLMTQWDNSASTTYYVSYPYVLHLAAGYHYFYWIPDSGWFYVTEVSVTKI